MTTNIPAHSTHAAGPAHVNALGSDWGRLPHAGERLEGLSRSYLYKLIMDGSIRSHVLKKRGAVRGCRLIHLPTLREFIADAGAKNP